MNHLAAVAFLCMGYATTRDEAQEWAQLAAQRDATPEELAQAWEIWDRAQDRSVQVIEVTCA